MKTILGFLLRIFSFAFLTGRRAPKVGPSADFNNFVAPEPKRSTAPVGARQHVEKRHGWLILHGQRPIVNSDEKRKRRAKHRRAMKDSKRVLQMAHDAPQSVSKNARRAALQKTRQRRNWKMARTRRREKAVEHDQVRSPKAPTPRGKDSRREKTYALPSDLVFSFPRQYGF